jgi:iron complex outermembrane recepter protein
VRFLLLENIFPMLPVLTKSQGISFIVISIVLSGAYGLPAFGAKAMPVVEELLVSAQMRPENAQQLALAIGVYDAAFIARTGANSLTDLEVTVPNINFGRGGRSTRGEIAIRGIGDFSRNIGMDARVAVYIDDVLTGRSSSFDQGLLDVARIEILRGPQGTLAGANALAGAINIITQKPHDKFSAQLDLEAGDYEQRSLVGKVNIPLTDDLYGSLLLGKKQQDGFMRNLTLNRNLQGVDRDLAKLKLRYLGVDNLTLDLGLDYLRDNTQATNAEALANGLFNGYTSAPAPYVVAHDAAEFEQRQLQGVSFNAVYEAASGYQLTAISALRESEFSELSEEDYSPLDVASSLFDERTKQVSQEFRLASPKYERFDYVVGAYFLDQDISTQRSATTGIYFRPAPNKFVTTPAAVGVQSAALYVHGTYELSERWQVTTGARYQREEKTIDYSILDTTGLFFNVKDLHDQQSFNELLPKVAVNFQVNPNTLFYASIARGYKSGGWNADFIKTLENFRFSPEYALNYELGAKAQFLDGLVTANSALFVTKLRDFQVFQFVPTTQAGGSLLSLTNAGKVTSQGLELDIGWQIIPSLRLSFNSAFTHAKFDSFKNGGGLGVDYDKKYLPYAPEHSYFVALDYARPLRADAEFYGHLDYGYSASYFSNPNNRPENTVPLQYQANARLGLELGAQWDISIWVKNLTDEVNLRQRSESFIGVPRGFYNPPRSCGLAINFSLN